MSNPAYEQVQTSEDEGQAAHAVAFAPRERQRQSNLPLFLSVKVAPLYLDETPGKGRLRLSSGPASETAPHPLSRSAKDPFLDLPHSAGTSVRRHWNQSLPAAARSRLGLTNEHL